MGHTSDKVPYPVRETVDPVTGSLTFPIHQTSAYLMPEGERYRYSRESNPTVEELARIINVLEGTEETTVFSSGMGAVSTTLMTLVKPGDRVLIHKDCFARSYKLVTEHLKSWGVKPVIPDLGNESILEKAGKADIVFLESVTNPILRVYDIEAIAEEVHSNGGVLVVDETFATPVNQRAAHHGADIVIHSLSKFMSGHNDTIGGSASGRKDLIDRIDGFRRTLGTTMDPNTAYLTIRGIKTLKTRMMQINATAGELAEKMIAERCFTNIRYPGLPDHPDSEIAKRMLSGYGGVITFDLSGVSDPLVAMKKLDVIAPANTLGGVNSTISHPSTMSHRSLTTEEKQSLGVKHETFRLSVGLEEPDTLLDDLKKMID